MVDLTDFSLSVILFCYDEVSLVYYSLKERLKLKRKHKLALSSSNCVIGREIHITFLKELYNVFLARIKDFKRWGSMASSLGKF